MTTTETSLPPWRLELHCFGHLDCTAGPGEHCVRRDGTPMLHDTHVWRSWQPITGRITAVAPAWSGDERRRWAEADIRADERAMVIQRVEAWLSTLPLDDRAHAAALAVIDVIREQR